MTADKQASGPTLAESAVGMWWGLLAGRIGQVRGGLAKDLQGTIQFSSKPLNEDEPPQFFGVQLDGPRSKAVLGLVHSPDTWVELDPEELAKLFVPGEKAEGALQVSGNDEVLTKLFASLQEIGGSVSWLQLRGNKS